MSNYNKPIFLLTIIPTITIYSMKQETQNQPSAPKRQYQTPHLRKVGRLSKITLKTGSDSDAGMKRVM
jgi:hypothetical protein